MPVTNYQGEETEREGETRHLQVGHHGITYVQSASGKVGGKVQKAEFFRNKNCDNHTEILEKDNAI